MTCLLMGIPVFADQSVEMADGMRAEGKIYVVVAVMTIVMVGLLLYVIRLERKLKGLEQHLQDQNKRTI